MEIVKDHNDNLKPGKPQLNWCDRAVMVCHFFNSLPPSSKEASGRAF